MIEKTQKPPKPDGDKPLSPRNGYPSRAFLVEAGNYEENFKRISIVFYDEQKAWEYCLRKCKNFHLSQKNWLKKKGFRGVINSKNDWMSITEVKCCK